MPSYKFSIDSNLIVHAENEQEAWEKLALTIKESASDLDCTLISTEALDTDEVEAEPKKVSKNFVCARTGNNALFLSTIEGYLFTNPDLDEDLYFMEVKLNVSEAAVAEAREIFNNQEIPENFSNDKELSEFIKKDFEDLIDDYEALAKLAVVFEDEWEFDQAVLMAVLYMQWVGDI